MLQFFISNVLDNIHNVHHNHHPQTTTTTKISMGEYSHQVGGHSTILTVDSKIYKPLINREFQFYQYLNNYKIFHNFLLSPYIPQFYGSTEVLKTLLDVDSTSTTNNSNNSSNSSSSSNKNSNQIEIDHNSNDRNQNSNSSSSNKNNNYIKLSSPNSSKMNNITKKKKPSSKHKIGTKKNYIILEDITVNYKKPCIVDIKIGTRQRGAICSSTTSTSLGARVCGMKLFIENFGYIVFDRFYGRSLNPESLENLLCHFFSISQNSKISLIENIIEKLSQIQKILSNPEDPFPFKIYSSSLLIVYEGENEMNCSFTGDADNKFVISSASSSMKDLPSISSSSSEGGNSESLSSSSSSDNLISDSSFQELIDDFNCKSLSSSGGDSLISDASSLFSSSAGHSEFDSDSDINSNSRFTSRCSSPELSNNNKEKRDSTESITTAAVSITTTKIRNDVKMIDFAHAIPSSDMQESTDDDGYIFGINNLMNILVNIKTRFQNSKTTDNITYSAASIIKDLEIRNTMNIVESQLNDSNYNLISNQQNNYTPTQPIPIP